jgi:hypothetical protein
MIPHQTVRVLSALALNRLIGFVPRAYAIIHPPH